MLLFPRLPSQVAQSLAQERATLASEELERLSDITDRAAFFGATGGTRATDRQIGEIQGEVRKVVNGLRGHGPAEQRRRFDALTAPLIHGLMPITPNEAAKPGVWAFLGCVVLPDAVRFRFPGDRSEGTDPERFLGRNRGMRNAFGRLWWRAYTLRIAGAPDEWALVEQLSEDELVQIMERSIIAGHPPLAREVARLLIATENATTMPRTEVMRDVSKRIRRRASLVPLESLPHDELERQVQAMFRETVGGTGATRASVAAPSAAPAVASRSTPAGTPPRAPEMPPTAVDPTDSATTVSSLTSVAPAKYPIVFERVLGLEDVRQVTGEQDVMLISRVEGTLLPLADHAEVIVTDERLGMQWAWHFKKRTGLRGRIDSSYLVTGVHNYLVTVGATAGTRLRLEGRRAGPWVVTLQPPKR